MKRILFAIPLLTHGGAERVVSILANQLAKLGYTVGIIVYKHSENEYHVDAGVDVYYLDIDENVNKIFRVISRITKIRQYIIAFNPDILIPFLPQAVVDLFFANLRLSYPTICTVRNNPSYMKTTLKERIYLYILRNSKSIYCQTPEQKNLLSIQCQKKAFILPNPIDVSFLNCFNKRTYLKNDRKLVSLGRLEVQKNQSLLIDAVVLIHSDFPTVSLSIYGEGPERENLQKKILDYKAGEYIFLMGRTEDVESVLLDSDIFVFASNYEGMPNALMEAMATGLPCISTDCPTGPRELLGMDERGLLVPVNDPLSMAEGIKKLLNSPSLSEYYGKKAHEFISDNFQIDKVTAILINHCTRVF